MKKRMCISPFNRFVSLLGVIFTLIVLTYCFVSTVTGETGVGEGKERK